jgi:hypothetical protein
MGGALSLGSTELEFTLSLSKGSVEVFYKSLSSSGLARRHASAPETVAAYGGEGINFLGCHRFQPFVIRNSSFAIDFPPFQRCRVLGPAP